MEIKIQNQKTKTIACAIIYYFHIIINISNDFFYPSALDFYYFLHRIMEFNIDDITPEEEEEMFQQLQKVVANSTLMSRKVEVDWSEWTNLEYLSETIIAANPLLFGLPSDYPCNVHRSRLPKNDLVEDPDVITLVSFAFRL